MARPASTIALATALLAGCGTGDETDSYRLVQVSGHVTLDGKPLEGAKVLFTPSEANNRTLRASTSRDKKAITN